MNYIGYDKNGKKLQVGDICNFELKSRKYEGIITYDEESFAYAFEMKSDNFPTLLMYNANYNSIERIINVTETKLGDEYEFYRIFFNAINE